jgi:hypothetical protein
VIAQIPLSEGKEACYMYDSQLRPPYALLFFGILMFAIAVFGTCTGQIWGRNGEKTFRAKDPKTFWLGIAAYYLAGIGLLGYYLYKIHAFAN